MSHRLEIPRQKPPLERVVLPLLMRERLKKRLKLGVLGSGTGAIDHVDEERVYLLLNSDESGGRVLEPERAGVEGEWVGRL